MGAMDFWSNMRKNRMNCSAGDVVDPSLVETAKRLELKPRIAVELVVVLLVRCWGVGSLGRELPLRLS
jgi:hypothetical protein